MSKTLLEFAKGNQLQKSFMWVTLHYNKGLVTCNGKLLKLDIDHDLIALDVAGLTPEEIKYFTEMDHTQVIENERERLMQSLSKSTIKTVKFVECIKYVR